ncbi:hypothetical protein [Desulfosporosinus acidiphilus]|nr:hypothetical protein [Desulfosporosinus acidiphilus]
MLTDDIDSLVSCALLKKIKGYETNYYYDFQTIYELKESDVPAIAVDCDLVNGRCWSNHVTMLSAKDSVNKKSANLNNIGKISRDNYFQKFCGSTAIQIWSFYDIPLPETEEGKMALLCLDVGFKGHYDSRFIEIHSKYLKALGFPELIEVLERHTSTEFYDLIRKYNMASKIKLNKNGMLTTDIDIANLQCLFSLDLSRPDKPFYIRREFTRDWPTCLVNYKTYTKDDFPEMFSVALINRNKVCFTKIK